LPLLTPVLLDSLLIDSLGKFADVLGRSPSSSPSC
jgi:hypothetical protein